MSIQRETKTFVGARQKKTPDSGWRGNLATLANLRQLYKEQKRDIQVAFAVTPRQGLFECAAGTEAHRIKIKPQNGVVDAMPMSVQTVQNSQFRSYLC